VRGEPRRRASFSAVELDQPDRCEAAGLEGDRVAKSSGVDRQAEQEQPRERGERVVAAEAAHVHRGIEWAQRELVGAESLFDPLDGETGRLQGAGQLLQCVAVLGPGRLG
jgi:hypothetical protein